MSYPGGKGGCFQKLINLIPPHNVYIESHIGGGAIMKNKRPARVNIGIDLSKEVIDSWKKFTQLGTSNKPIMANHVKNEDPISCPGNTVKNIDGSGNIIENNDNGSVSTSSPKKSSGAGNKFFQLQTHHRQKNCINLREYRFFCCDAIGFLENYKFRGNEFVYCDPPYLPETRKGGKLYNFEYSREDHEKLLKLLISLKCMVMISGYYSELYMNCLKGWETYSFQNSTRQGMVTEWVWMNYSPPMKLHEYWYLGDSFRDRERIRRKVKRWSNRIKKLPVLEREAIKMAIL